MQKQQGFIQGALLIGIALLAVVIGAFAMASNNNTADTSKEKVKTNAAVSVKKMADTFELYQITAAQKNIDAADTAITNLNLTLPQGFAKDSYVIDNTATGGAPAAELKISVNTEDACAAINRVLGLAASDANNHDALAVTVADEGCAGTATYGGFSGTYMRVFRKS